MKNLKKIIAIMLSLTSTVSVMAMPEALEVDNDYILYEEFTPGAGGNRWNFSRAAIKDDVLILAEGVSVSNGSIAATATCSVSETRDQNTVIDISFDVRPGKNLTTITQVGGLKGNVMPVTFDKSGEICINSYGISEEKSRTYKAYIPDNWYHVEVAIDQTAERMITSIYDKSTGELVARKQMIEYKPLDSWKDMMSGGIKNFIFQTNMGDNKDFTPSYFDNLRIKFLPIGYDVYTNTIGNNFGRDGTDDIQYKVVNTFDSSYECEIEWKVEELDLGLIKEGVERFSINGLSEHKLFISADVQRYGLYKITSRLSYYSGEQKIEVGAETELYFSKVLSSDEGEFSSRLGFANNASTRKMENMKLMEMIGSAGSRQGLFSWNAVQNGQGIFDYSFNQEAADAWSQSNMPSNVFLLAYGNKAFVEQVDFNGNPATPDAFRPPKTEEEIERFGDYVDYVIDRVGDYVDYYEVWNEFSGSTLSNVYGGKLLAEITKEAYERIKERDPSAKVIGLAGVMMRDVEFAREFFEAGGAKYCDAVSIHPYNSDGAAIFPKESWMVELRGVVDIIREYEPTMPIYFTEIGWSSYWDNTTEMDKGRAVVKSNISMLAHNMAEKIYIHNFQNIGLNPNDREHQFGFLTAKGDYRGELTALPGFVITAAMNKLLPGEITCEGKVEKLDRLIAAYNIKREDNKNVAVMWASTLKNVDISLDLGCGSVDAYDEYGNFIETIYSENGVFDFGLSNKVMYAIGNFTKFEEADTTVTHKDASYISTLNDVMTVRVHDKLSRNGTIEVECNEEVMTLISDCVMKSGVAELSFKTSSDNMGDFPLNFKVYDENGKCIYVAQNTVTINEPVSIEVNPVNYFNSDSRWGVELTIRNNANIASVKGVAKITGPEWMAEKCSSDQFASIEPQSSEKVYINLPEMLKKRTVTIMGEVELDYGYEVDFSRYLDFTSAYYASKKPEIDGKINEGEWTGLAMAATNDENWTSLMTDKPWNGPGDNSLDSMNIMWDEENLYIAAVVKDDTFVKTPTKLEAEVTTSSVPEFYLWQYDSIQFGIEDEYFNVPNRLKYPFTEIGLALGDNGAFAYRFSSQTEMPVGKLENCEVAITESGNEIIYECSIPWSELREDGYIPNEELIYAFAALVNDNDGAGRKGFIMYNDGIGTSKSIEKFGQMKLRR